MRKILLTLMTLSLLFGVLAGCNGQQAAPAEQTEGQAAEQGEKIEEAAAEELRAVFLLTQPLSPFEEDIWNWINQAKEEGYLTEAKLIEMKSPTEYEQTIRQVSEQGYDIVISTFFFVKEAFNNVAPDFPDTNYILVYEPNDAGHENMLGILYDVQEGSYVCGVVAGHMTETGRVGFIGGDNSPGIVKFLAGFEAGVLSVDPDITVDVNFAGTFIDPEKGHEMALSLYGRGADIVMHAANKTGLGVFTAAQEVDKWVVGVDIDQQSEAPEHVICSALTNPGMSVYNAIVATAEGTFEGGTLNWGVDDGAPAAAITENASEEAKQAGLDAQERIASGEIIPPQTTGTE